MQKTGKVINFPKSEQIGNRTVFFHKYKNGVEAWIDNNTTTFGKTKAEAFKKNEDFV